MDWFEILTGFRETDYDDTRAKLMVEGSRLRSLVNGKDYGIGELEQNPLDLNRKSGWDSQSRSDRRVSSDRFGER
jgi:hypothetical protein